MIKSWKYCNKRWNGLFWPISPYIAMFSKVVCNSRHQMSSVWSNGLKNNFVEAAFPTLFHFNHFLQRDAFWCLCSRSLSKHCDKRRNWAFSLFVSMFSTLFSNNTFTSIFFPHFCPDVFQVVCCSFVVSWKGLRYSRIHLWPWSLKKINCPDHKHFVIIWCLVQ